MLSVVVAVVTDLSPSSVERFALSCFLELCHPSRLWPGLGVLVPCKYVDLSAVYTNWMELPVRGTPYPALVNINYVCVTYSLSN